MLESLHMHYPQAHVYVLCLSDVCYAALTKIAYPYVSLIRLADLEAADIELTLKRSTRSLVEYYFTITPCLPWYLLRKNRSIEEITYLDADMFFFSSPEPIFEEAKNASVIIMPHRFASHLSSLVKFGIYNVSWLTFRSTKNGMSCLAWYRNACLEWCFDKLEDGRFADQKYLDQFPKLFDGVHAIQHQGAGVAPWNLADSIVSLNGINPTINNELLIFYHAHAFSHICGPCYSSGLYEYKTVLTPQIREVVIKPYIKKYVAVISEIKAKNIIGLKKFTGIRYRNFMLKKIYKFIKNAIKIIYQYKNKDFIFYT